MRKQAAGEMVRGGEGGREHEIIEVTEVGEEASLIV